jgi:hypothetical protein
LASGIVFQVDQTTPATQSILWPLRELGEVPDLERDMRVPSGGHSEKANWSGEKFERDIADHQCWHI